MEGCLNFGLWFIILITLVFFASGYSKHLFEGFNSLLERFGFRSIPEPSVRHYSLDPNGKHIASYTYFFKHLCSGLIGSYNHESLSDGSEQETFEGELGNHTVRLNYNKRKKKQQNLQRTRDIRNENELESSEVLEIRMPVQQKFWLRFYRQRLQEEDADEIQSGFKWLDREYVIHTNQREAAEDFLRRLSVQKHLSGFPCSFDKLEIVQGEVCMTLNDPSLWRMAPSHLKIVLQKLLLMIKEYEEHQLIALRIFMSQSTSRCPYCRNQFDQNLEAIVRCQSCSTHLHESCWNESRQCTTWGCKSTLAESTNTQIGGRNPNSMIE